jgi:hypothetical protein
MHCRCSGALMFLGSAGGPPGLRDGQGAQCLRCTHKGGERRTEASNAMPEIPTEVMLTCSDWRAE